MTPEELELIEMQLLGALMAEVLGDDDDQDQDDE